MKVPPHIISCTEKFALLGFGSHMQKISLDENDDTNKTQLIKNLHSGFIKNIVVSSKSDYVATTGDDKIVRLYKLPNLEFVSSRNLGKRPNKIAFASNGTELVVGDKFGDVWSFNMEDLISNPNDEGKFARKGRRIAAPVLNKPGETSKEEDTQEDNGTESKQSNEKEEQEQEQEQDTKDDEDNLNNGHEPSLGHVSMLTGLLFLPDSKRIITSDRDEHVRVSKWPNAYNIDRFLTGHEKFVSALSVLDNGSTLISAGGDDFAYVWDLEDYSLRTTIDLKQLANHVVIPDIRSKKVKQAHNLTDEQIMCKKNAVNNIVSLTGNDSNDYLVFSSSGSTALAFVRQADLTNDKGPLEASYLDVKYPILSMSTTVDKKSLLLTLDTSINEQESTNTKFIQQVSMQDGQLILQDSPLASRLSQEASIEVSSEDPIPERATFYFDLFYLTKDPCTIPPDVRLKRRPEASDESTSNKKTKV